MSRASATIARAFAAWFIFARDAMAAVIRPASASFDSRQHISCIEVISASIRASLSCTSWKPAIGWPNCSRRSACASASS